MRSLAEKLSSSGFAVLRFDFSGNGGSEGAIEETTYTTMLGEVESAVDFLQLKGYTEIGIAGHSLGAMIALLSASSDKRIGAVAFIAGSSLAARVREVFPHDAIEKAEKEGSAEAQVYGRNVLLTRDFLLDIDRYNVGHSAATLNRPLLVVHGTEDDVIEPHHGRKIFLWAEGQKKLELIKGADHMFRDDRHLETLLSAVSGWFLDHIRDR